MSTSTTSAGRSTPASTVIDVVELQPTSTAPTTGVVSCSSGTARQPLTVQVAPALDAQQADLTDAVRVGDHGDALAVRRDPEGDDRPTREPGRSDGHRLVAVDAPDLSRSWSSSTAHRRGRTAAAACPRASAPILVPWPSTVPRISSLPTTIAASIPSMPTAMEVGFQDFVPKSPRTAVVGPPVVSGARTRWPSLIAKSWLVRVVRGSYRAAIDNGIDPSARCSGISTAAP